MMDLDYNGIHYKYNDTCYKPDNICQIQCIMEYETESEMNNLYLSLYELIYKPINSTYISNSIMCIYYSDRMINDGNVLQLFDRQFIDTLSSINNPDYTLSYYTDYSFEDELNKAIITDTISFVMTFICLSMFVSLILMRFKKHKWCFNICPYKIDFTKSRGFMGSIGIFSAGLAVISCFGIVGGIMGVKFNAVVSITPFLLLGLGIDDAFVLLRSYDLTHSKLSIQQRIILTMERGGVSILFTSLTDLVAFCIGYLSKFEAISAFCVYCGVGIFLDFIFQVTFFLGFLVLHSQWQLYGCVFCKNKYKNICKDKDIVTSNLNMDLMSDTPDAFYRLSSNDQNNNANDADDDKDDIKSINSQFIDEDSTSKLMTKYGEYVISKTWVKVVTLIFFIGYIGVSILGILELESYQDPIDLVSRNSYVKTYYNDYDKYFNVPNSGPFMYFGIDKELNYNDAELMTVINDMIYDIESNECFEMNQHVYWLNNYIDYLTQINMSYPTNNDTMFYNILYDQFLPIYTTYDDIIWKQNKNSNSINRTRVLVKLKPVGTSTKALTKCLPFFKDVSKKYDNNLGLYYHEPLLVFCEADAIIFEQTLFNLLYAMGAAFIITILLVPYPFMSLIIMVTVAQILIGILGFMSLWGLPLNTNTMINLVISIGFSVDNAAHICHAYIKLDTNKYFTNIATKAEERKERILYSLNAVGIPIICGDLSTIIAIIPLAGAQSEIFISFFKVLTLSMLFGILHAMIYLPVILSLIGPIQKKKNNDKLQPLFTSINSISTDRIELK